MKSICLNMIVKNESEVIESCLASVKNLIDSWVIVDTGSEDGTQEIIRESLRGIPGELHERPWIHFAHNRNEAMALAKGRADYLLLIDADEVLLFEEGFVLPELEIDLYLVVNRRKDGMNHHRALLVNNHLEWEWLGVLHEYLRGKSEGYRCEFIKGVENVSKVEGSRSKDPQKYLKDARLLEEALKENPEDERTLFYLAQSYRDAGEYALAYQYYEKRSQVGGRPEVVFFSLYMMAWVQQKLGQEGFIEGFCRAHLHSPNRAEPFFWMAHHYLVIENYFLAELVLKYALEIPQPPPDTMRIETTIYEYGFLWQFAVASLGLGQHEAADRAFGALLAKSSLPQSILEAIARDQIQLNQRWPRSA